MTSEEEDAVGDASGLPILCPPGGLTWDQWIRSRSVFEDSILLVKYEIIMLKNGSKSSTRKRELLHNANKRLKRLIAKCENIPHDYTASSQQQLYESFNHYENKLVEEQREKKSLREKRRRAEDPTIVERLVEFQRLKNKKLKISSTKERMMQTRSGND